MDQSPKMPRLQIGAENRFLFTEFGTPFFWLADTAWELFHRLSREDAVHYLKNRAKKGFNVVQAVILAELDGLNTPNFYGESPLIDNDPTKPNEGYFEHVDFVVNEAEKLGIYMALLPTWGDKYHKAWGLGPEIFTPDNAEHYGAFLANRYIHHNNIIWILGGDRIPADQEDYEINCRMAEGIKKYDSVHLIAIHPMGGNIASDIYGNEDWMDINMFQSRHQIAFKEYKFTLKAIKSLPIRPVIDGEPGYENIPNLLNKLHLQRLTAADVRRSAYWNMMAGAAGHTYGCNEVWQMYKEGLIPLHGAQMNWKQALDLPGAAQMGIMRILFESLPWTKLENDQEFVGGFNLRTPGYILAMVAVDKKTALAYTPLGRPIKARLSRLQAGKVSAYWFDPKEGNLVFIEKYPCTTTVTFKPAKRGRGQDQVLVILAEEYAEKWLTNFPEKE